MARWGVHIQHTGAQRALLALTLVLGGCVGLRLTVVDSAYQRPSNVAVYFTVDAANGDPVGGLTAEDFRDSLTDLVWYLDEPLADDSCIPLYFIARLATLVPTN